MFGPPTISFDGKYYTLVEHWKPDPRLGQAVSGFSAEHILAGMMRDPTACVALRELYMQLAYESLLSHVSDQSVLRWFVRQLSDSFGGGQLQLLERDTFSLLPPVSSPSVELPAAVKEAQRIDALIAQLGTQDVAHRGRRYRVTRAQRNQELPEREHYEVLSEREAHGVLKELTEDAHRPEHTRAALGELLQALDKHRGNKALELLLLRAYRVQVVPETQGAPITPFQMKPKEEHWVEVWTLDKEEKPVPGVLVELLFANGDVKRTATNGDGILHVAGLKAGDVTIRLPDRDGESWSAPGGSSPTPASQSGATRVHVVKKGECLSKLAHRYGLANWKKLWEHPDNAGLRKKRKNPNVLYPGDQVYVPGVEVREVKRPVNQVHRIEVTPPKGTQTLTLTFKDCEGRVLADQSYELGYKHRGKDELIPGKLDDKGKLEHEVPVDLGNATLRFTELGEQFELTIGGLNDMQKDEGVFAPEAAESRLAALGYLHRAPGNDPLSDASAALCAFQFKVMGTKDPTGQLDQDTCLKLQEVYGA